MRWDFKKKQQRQTSKKYTLARLLSKQPKTLRKNRDYDMMTAHLRSSVKLKQLRFGRRCYTLLNKAKILPENLKYFYRTYRLPKDPFFPLFLKIKQEYLNTQNLNRKKRIEYIARRMKELPPEELSFIKYLAELEKKYHPDKHYPIWEKHLFPKTKKQADLFHKYCRTEWDHFFKGFLNKFIQRYKLKPGFAEKLLARYILGLFPGTPVVETIKKRFRTLCKRHHPDKGGNSAAFRQLKWAKEVLTG